MSALTRKQVEEWRDHFGHYYDQHEIEEHDARLHAEAMQLCDLALRALEQNSAAQDNRAPKADASETRQGSAPAEPKSEQQVPDSASVGLEQGPVISPAVSDPDVAELVKTLRLRSDTTSQLAADALERISSSEREGWRYAMELEKDRMRLQRETDEERERADLNFASYERVKEKYSAAERALEEYKKDAERKTCGSGRGSGVGAGAPAVGGGGGGAPIGGVGSAITYKTGTPEDAAMKAKR